MATVVQSTSKVATGVNNTTLAFGSNLTAGNLIAVSQASWLSGHTITTPTDTIGHTYVPMAAEQSTVNVRLRSFYVEDIAAGANTVTFDISGASNGELSVVVSEVSGLKTSSPLDQTNTGGGTGTAVSSGNITPTQNNCFLYGAMTANSNNVGITEEAGWTLLQEQIPAGAIPVATEWKNQTTVAAEDADWTLASSPSWIAHVAAFLPDDVVSPIPGYVLVKDWDFGTNITNQTELEAEFYTRYIFNQGTLDFLVDEWQRYRDNNNHVFSGDHLSLVARVVGGLNDGGLESGMLRSKWIGKYGLYETRMKMAPGRGLWPAFWLTSQDMVWPPEIDVFEIINAGASANTTHSFHYLHGIGQSILFDLRDGNSRYVPGFDYADAYHTFLVEWTPTYVKHFVDGVLVVYRTYPWQHNSGADGGPAHVLANLGVGGPDTPTGAPTTVDDFPASLEIDYIRVWQLPTNAPTFVQKVETAWTGTTTPKTTPSFPVVAGDLLVAFAANEGNGNVDQVGTPTNTGTALTWTLRQSVAVSGWNWVSVWTAPATVTESITVSFARTGGTFTFGGSVQTFRNHGGVGASSKTNATSGAPTLNIATTAPNSAIAVFNSDFDSVGTPDRVWRFNAGALQETTYVVSSGEYAVYGGYYDDSGAVGTYAVGLTSPATQKYAIVALEVLAVPEEEETQLISLVQSTKKIVTGVNNTTLAFTSNVTAGNLLIVTHVQSGDAGSSITTPTDTLGNTYVAAAAEQLSANSSTRTRSFYVKNCLGGACTVTFDAGGTFTGIDLSLSISEFSGVDKSSPLVGTPGLATGTSATPTTANTTPTENNCLLYGAMTHRGSNSTITQESGWTLLEENEGGTSNMPIATAWKIQTTAAAENVNWTLGTGTPEWLCHIVAFKPQAVSSDNLLYMGVGG